MPYTELTQPMNPRPQSNWGEINERRVSEKTQEIYNYCKQSRQDMTETAFKKAKESLKILLTDVKECDRYHLQAIRSVLDSIDKRNDILAVCSTEQADRIAKVLVYQGFRDDLNLYPVRAAQKIGRDEKRGVITDYNVEELTSADMMYFIRAHVNGANLSRHTMPSIYRSVKECFGLDLYMAKIIAQLFFNPMPISRIRHWNDNRAGSTLLAEGKIFVENNNRANLNAEFAALLLNTIHNQ